METKKTLSVAEQLAAFKKAKKNLEKQNGSEILIKSINRKIAKLEAQIASETEVAQ